MHEFSLAHLLESPEPLVNSTSAPSSPNSRVSGAAAGQVETPIRSEESQPHGRLQVSRSRPITRSLASFPIDALNRTSSVPDAPSATAPFRAPSILTLSPSPPLFLRAPTISATFSDAAGITSSPPSLSENSTSFSSPNSSHYRDGEPFPSRLQLPSKQTQASTTGACLTCNICQQSFATKTFLTRHIASHQNASPKKRRRIEEPQGASQSFQPCRSCVTARASCNDARPCRRCISWKIKCIPSSELPSTATGRVAPGSSDNASAGSWRPGIPNSQTPISNDKLPSLPIGLSLNARHLTDKTLPAPQESISISNTTQLPYLDSAQAETTESMAGFGRVPSLDLLREMLYQRPPKQGQTPHSQTANVLGFCDDVDLQITDSDLSHLVRWNMESMARGTVMAPEGSGTFLVNPAEPSQRRQNFAKIWTNSPWRWKALQHSVLGTERAGSSNAVNNIGQSSGARRGKSQDSAGILADDMLDQSRRDRVLAMVLSVCRQETVAMRWAASFPAVDAMNLMIHIFLEAHRCQGSQWIHFPSLTLNMQSSEWLAVAAAAGAILTALPSLRKLGFVLKETARLSTISKLEEDDGLDRENLVAIQTIVLGLDLGIWSGNHRKMRVAESGRSFPVTMMRFGGRLFSSSYTQIIVNLSDEGEILDGKWRLWANQEQWKRLIFHCFIREAQLSMTNWTNPCLSYAELLLPLPDPKELWFAETASEWKKLYLEKCAKQSGKAPTIGSFLQNAHQVQGHKGRLDIQLSILVFLHGFWSMILEYRQLSAVHNFRSYCKESANLLLSFRHQELLKSLQGFFSLSQEWHEMSARENMILNLLMMNLHVSLDDLQSFLGKRGDDEARRVYPILQEWVSSHDGRASVWYAGQVLRYAKLFPPGHLRDFYAVAVFHAALGLWTYGVVFRANGHEAMMRQDRCEPVWLDGEDMAAMQRFLGSKQRKPLIHDLTTGNGGRGDVLLYDAARCMEVVHEILQRNFRTAEEALPALVENLCQLIKQLGKVAWAISLS